MAITRHYFENFKSRKSRKNRYNAIVTCPQVAIFCAQEGGIFNFQRNKTDPPQAQAAVEAGAYGGGAAGRGGTPGDPAGGAGERRCGERPQG